MGAPPLQIEDLHVGFAPQGGPCKLMTRDAALQQRIPLDRVMVDLATTGKIRFIDLLARFCPG